MKHLDLLSHKHNSHHIYNYYHKYITFKWWKTWKKCFYCSTRDDYRYNYE